MRVLKYQLPMSGTGTFPLSDNGRILKVGKQRNTLVIWVLDETDTEVWPRSDRTVFVFETGDENGVVSHCYYLGTVAFHQLADEDYVVHVFMTYSGPFEDPRMSAMPPYKFDVKYSG